MKIYSKIHRALITAYNSNDGHGETRHYRTEFNPPVAHHKHAYGTTDVLRLWMHVVNVGDEIGQHGGTLRARRIGFTQREKEESKIILKYLLKRRREAQEKSEAMRKKAELSRKTHTRQADISDNAGA